MKDLVKFEFKSREIRTVTIDGNPYWVAKDVAEVLGYANTNEAISRHCRGVAKRYPIVDALGRTQEARVIGESDLYRLIAHSNLPAAEEFEAWIYEKVLPTIRKTGVYVPEDYVKALRAYADALEEKQLAEKKVDALQIALSESKEWYSVIRMNKLNGRRERDEYFDWKPLKKASASLGYEVKKVFDQNYGKINAYHRDVWEEVYGTEINFGD